MKRKDVALPGGTMACLAGGQGPTLLFAHATGMLAPVYRALLAPLSARFRVIAYDARGHGATSLPADPAAVEPDWQGFADDLVALADALGGGPMLLAGHSFGATVAMMAAAAQPGLANAVLMIDPAFIPFGQAADYGARRVGGETMPNIMAELAERRRGQFADRAAMRERYAGRGVFTGWPVAALDAYVAAGARAADGGVTLACAPAYEAAVFRAVSTLLEAAVLSGVPFALLAGETGSTVTDPDLAAMRDLPACRGAARLAGTGHFLPVTHEEAVCAWMDAAAQALE